MPTSPSPVNPCPHKSRIANINQACDEELVAITNILSSSTKARLEITIPPSASPGIHGFSMRLAVMIESSLIALVDTAQCHGNCGILVVFHANIPNSINQGKGIGRLFEKIIVKAAIDCRYSCLLSTTISQMKIAEKLLTRAGWEKQIPCDFNNRRSGNQVSVWIKKINTATKVDSPLFMGGMGTVAVAPNPSMIEAFRGGSITITGGA